jgi:hypothetical protein
MIMEKERYSKQRLFLIILTLTFLGAVCHVFCGINELSRTPKANY